MTTSLRRMGLVTFALFTVLSLSACRRPQTESQTARVDKLFTAWNTKGTPGCADKLGAWKNF